MEEKKVLERTIFTVFFFSLLGGIYVIIVSFFAASTLPTQLSHLTPWLRTDTFGIFCWIVAFFSFLWWNIIRK